MPEQADAPTPSSADRPGRKGNGVTATLPGPMKVQSAVVADDEVDVAPSRKLGILGWISVGWLTLIGLSALLAPVLPLKDPNSRTGPTRLPPLNFADLTSGNVDFSHPLGTNASGRDMLSQIVFGARASLFIAVGAVLIGLIIGGLLGLLAGYVRGPIDTVITMAFNVMLSVPALVLAMALVAVFASTDDDVSSFRRLVVITVAIGIVSIPLLGRITRGSALTWSERDFVKAAQVAGAKPARIMFREVLPNVAPAMFSIALLGIAVAVVAEGGLSILGVGVQGQPSWGQMIATSRDQLSQADSGYMVFIPSIAIFLTVLSLNYLGDVVRARFDVRESVL